MGTALERIKKGTDIQREVGCWRCGCGTIEDTGKAAAGYCTEGNNVKGGAWRNFALLLGHNTGQ